MNKIITITGPSGVGKSTLIDEVQASSNARQACSVTTRPIRGKDDRRYPVTMAQFLEMQQNGELLESIIYDGHAYGISKQIVTQLLAEGPTILDCNHAGVCQVLAADIAPTITVFLVTDAKTLFERQIRRGAGTAESRLWRLKQSLIEIEDAASQLYDYVIRSDELATEKLLHLVNGKPIESDTFDIAGFKEEMQRLIYDLEHC